jgi:hypothetical protein
MPLPYLKTDEGSSLSKRCAPEIKDSNTVYFKRKKDGLNPNGTRFCGLLFMAVANAAL